MEQHLIPRDITGFKFKLVGTMTLKQFGYVAGGALVGYVFFKAPIGIFQLPLASFFWFLGFALAFIPIQERSLDRWLIAFVKSVYSPTQFVWKKIPPELEILSRPNPPQKGKSPHLSHFEDSRKKLAKYLSALPVPLEEQLDQREREVLSRALAFFQTSIEEKKTSTTPPVKPKPKAQSQPTEKPSFTPISPSFAQRAKPIIPPPLRVKKEQKGEEAKEEILILKKETPSYEKGLKEKIENLKKELELETISKARFLELSQELTCALEEKRRLEKELGTLRQKVGREEKEVVVPKAKLKEEEPRVKIITPKLASEIGIANVPQSPNIINGIIKDPLGRLLPGVIITVKNEAGTTVRALKSNNIGLFVSATPLTSGTYTLEIEDPKKRFEFDIIKVTLQGEIYSPLEISAKGEKERLREGLTTELFGQTQL